MRRDGEIQYLDTNYDQGELTLGLEDAISEVDEVEEEEEDQDIKQEYVKLEYRPKVPNIKYPQPVRRNNSIVKLELKDGVNLDGEI